MKEVKSIMKQPYVYKLYSGKVKKLGDPNATNPMEREWETGMFKDETTKKLWLTKTGLQGDEVADKKNHGGPEKALFAYSIKHYEYWRKDLRDDSINVGAFGENLAVKNMDEKTVCIGDTYQLDEAIIQVSQPRRPCWKPARRFRVMDFALRIQNSGLTGWYYRVLKEGYIESGSQFQLIERPYSRWTIEFANDVMYNKGNMELTEELANCNLLATNWKQTLSRRLEGYESPIERRVYGPNKKQ